MIHGQAPEAAGRADSRPMKNAVIITQAQIQLWEQL